MAKVGEKIGDWILRRHIRDGGQGAVYAASKEEGNEEVAIKIIKATRLKKRSRFIQEIATHALLSGEKAQNIIPILDHNLDDLEQGGVKGFVVMPLAQSTLEDQRDLLIGRVELCLEIFTGIANGIKNAHAAGIIHRDIKPGNVLFLDQSLKTPLVSDFGICLLRDTPDEERLTEVGESVGAKFFMAPEQERGGVSEIGTSADIYALGKLLHNMLTGRFLFREEVDKAFTSSELDSDPRFKKIKEQILAKTIIADPNTRIQSAQELLDIASSILGHDIPSSDQGGASKIQTSISDSSPPPSAENETAAYSNFNDRLIRGEIAPFKLEFDRLKSDFQSNWSPIHEAIKTSPREGKAAAVKLISAQRKTTALFLAISRCDADSLFRSLKQFLEYVIKSSEHQSGYPAVFTVPHLFAGFLYMATSLVAFRNESWKIFHRLLTEKFEWYYQSGRPLFSFGFALSYFFHCEALGRSASHAHDFYRERLIEDPIIQSIDPSNDDLLTSYVQLQFLMSLRGAQCLESGDEIPLWPDFGRFHGYRVQPLLDRIYSDSEYGIHILQIFDESKIRFFEKLNPRIAMLRKRLQGDRYFWDSIDSWEPR